MILTITFENQNTLPGCGFKALYRAKGGSIYATLDSSGSASGTTSVQAPIASPRCIEGYVYADCCDGSLSSHDPYGINSYLQLSIDGITISQDPPPPHYEATVSAEYANPYDTIVTGTFYTNASGGTTLPFELTFPADTTEATITLEDMPTPSPGDEISDITITGISPIFNGGGELQLLDPVNTPLYFSYIIASGFTWDGSPTSLASFTLDGLVVTEQDPDLTITGANLIVSWIYDSVYEDGEMPYDNVTFEVYDLNDALVGTTTIATGTKGLREAVIPLERVAVDLNTSNQFTMVTKWDNNAEIATKAFYLPAP